ncbi:MAG: NADPH:quinone reductase [Candidatus Omnitrophota bacterium]
MKCVRVEAFGGPDVLRVEEVKGLAPDSRQVLIDVRAIGVNPVDTYIRSGLYPVKPNLPYTPGFDAAGFVKAIGRGVKNAKINERVYVFGSVTGTYAQEVVCLDSQIYPLPKNISFEQGASLGIPYTAAYCALWGKARPKAGETVLIHGASGGVGIACIQFAKKYGLKIIGTVGTDKARDLLGQLGARDVVNHHSSDFFDNIMKITRGEGVDIIMEMRADLNLDQDLRLLKKRGRIVVVGCRGSVTINPREAMSRDAMIIGMSVMNVPAAGLRRIHSVIQEGLMSGGLRPVVGKCLPLADAALAHKVILEPGACGKIILLP